MRFGTKCPTGFLPVFSVNDEFEAKRLLTLACPTNLDGEYIAPGLVHAQTLTNLTAFGDQLERYYEVVKLANGSEE